LAVVPNVLTIIELKVASQTEVYLENGSKKKSSEYCYAIKSTRAVSMFALGKTAEVNTQH